MKHFLANCWTFPYDILYILWAKKNSYKVLEKNYKLDNKILAKFKESFSDMLKCGSKGRWTAIGDKHIIIIPDFVINPFYLWVVQHETYHAIHDIMRVVWIPHNEDTEEVFAYLTQHLTTQVFAKFF